MILIELVPIWCCPYGFRSGLKIGSDLDPKTFAICNAGESVNSQGAKSWPQLQMYFTYILSHSVYCQYCTKTILNPILHGVGGGAFLDIIKNISKFLGPPRTPPTNKKKKMKVSHMECWVSKYGKKGAWSLFLKEFYKNI